METRTFRSLVNGHGKGISPVEPPKVGLVGGRPYNHYTCQVCGRVTTTKHEQDGVTPFWLGCRATEGCTGRAESAFYRGPQHEPQLVHVTWVRPEGEALEQMIAAFPDEADRDWVREHYAKGGCLIKEGPGSW